MPQHSQLRKFWFIPEFGQSQNAKRVFLSKRPLLKQVLQTFLKKGFGVRALRVFFSEACFGALFRVRGDLGFKVAFQEIFRAFGCGIQLKQFKPKPMPPTLTRHPETSTSSEYLKSHFRKKQGLRIYSSTVRSCASRFESFVEILGFGFKGSGSCALGVAGTLNLKPM